MSRHSSSTFYLIFVTKAIFGQKKSRSFRQLNYNKKGAGKPQKNAKNVIWHKYEMKPFFFTVKKWKNSSKEKNLFRRLSRFFCMSVYGSDQNCYCIFQKRNTFLRKGFLPISRNTWEKIAGLFIKCSLPETSRPFILVKWKMVQHCIRATAALYYYHDTTIYYLVLLSLTNMEFWWRLPSFSSKRPNRFHTWADTLLPSGYNYVSLTLSPPKPNRESQSFLPPTPTFACTWRIHWCIPCKTFCHWISFYWLRLWEHWDRILWVRLIWPHGSDLPHASYHYKTGHPRSAKNYVFTGSFSSCFTVFENHPKCRSWVFQF